MKKVLIILGTVFLISNFCFGQDNSFKPQYSTILKQGRGKELMGQCTRCMPVNVFGFWEPTDGEVEQLHNNFKKILQIKSTKCSVSFPNQSISTLDRYSFQYIGVYINGKRFIYVNAFSGRDTKDNWKTEPVGFCDGGRAFWGALFSVEKLDFTRLDINDAG